MPWASGDCSKLLMRSDGISVVDCMLSFGMLVMVRLLFTGNLS